MNWRLGNQDAYVADQITALKKNGRDQIAAAFATGYQKAKLQGACLAIIEALKAESREGKGSAYEIATYYALIHDREHTFEWLEKAYKERSAGMEYLKVEDFLQPFRSDPRYVDLLRRLRLDQ